MRSVPIFPIHFDSLLTQFHHHQTLTPLSSLESVKWQSSGARIKISGRGGFLPGTTDRKVTISGFQASIDLAVSIIERKVDKASKRRAKDETDMDTD